MSERFYDLINKLHVGVVVQGPSTEVMVCNPASLELLGLDEDQYRGKTSYDPEWNIIREDGTPFPAEDRPMARVIASGRGVSNVVMGVYRPRTKDRVWLMVHAEPETDASGRIVQIVATLFDISERRRLEASLLEARKLESIGRLAGGIAHDFNNLLAVITAATSLAMESAPEDGELREELAMTLDAASRAASLTRQLLTFARRQPIKPAVVNPREVVLTSAPLLTRVLGSHIDLTLSCATDTWSALIDPSEIEQVLVNLAANARDAMPSGGTVRLTTDNFVQTDVGAMVPPGEYTRLTVADSGDGMSRDTIERIFEPFFTTKDRTGGTGLGLATVHGIVVNSGGYIAVASEPAQGTTFTIYLPRAFPRPQLADVAVHSVPAPRRGGGETVMVVEDERVLRVLSERILRSLGYRVLVASNGEEALALAQAHVGEIDLLFTDLIMPRMQGVVLATALRALRPSLRVLITSGYADAARTTLHAFSLLEKPYTPDVLAVRIRDVLDSPVA
jgi:PAS domain S-box-containing protein